MKVVNVQELINHIVSETNIFAVHKGYNFVTNYDKLRPCLGVNYLVEIIKLPSVANYRKVDHCIINDGFTWWRCKSFKVFFKTFTLKTMIKVTMVTKAGLYLLCLGAFIILFLQNLPLFLPKSSMEITSILDIEASTFARPATSWHNVWTCPYGLFPTFLQQTCYHMIRFRKYDFKYVIWKWPNKCYTFV